MTVISEASGAAGREHYILAKKAQTSAEPCKVVGCEMTVLQVRQKYQQAISPQPITYLWLMVPPAFDSVEPKMAKKTMGAMKLLKAKKY